MNGQIHPLDMQQQRWFWIIGQFATIVLLGLAVWYFERRQTALEERLLQCQGEKIDRLLSVIEDNTIALRQLAATTPPESITFKSSK